MTTSDTSVGKKQYEGTCVAITAWHFPTSGWQFQITAKDEEMKRSGNGYLILSLEGAAELWRELSHVLRDRGVMA